MEENMKILVVDDEIDLCEIIKFNLENEGFSCDTAYSAEDALTKDLPQYQLFIFDIMMGETSGYALGKITRNNPKTAHIPIIFATAKDSETDTLKGFEVGADDYITKPFSVKELVARVKAVLRRHSQPQEKKSDILTYKTLSLDLTKKKLFINEQEILLTKKEFGILELLLKNPNKILNRNQILEQVWEKNVYVLDRTIDVNITRLRKKIKPYSQQLVSRSGFGYCFNI